MGMFDWYQPKVATICPECGYLLETWQGKDGPCLLFVWREGIKYPENHPDTDDAWHWSSEDLTKVTLPDVFYIYSYDCPLHKPIEAICTTQEDVWIATGIQPFLIRKKGNTSRH